MQNAMCIDLHTHSTYSDGTCTPAELVDMAIQHNLHALALTDHDTVDGVAMAQQLGQAAGLLVLSGVEISTTLRQHTLHILGYGIDPNDKDLQEWLRPLQESRKKRNSIMIGKLQALGIDISEEELALASPVGQTGRPHIARILIDKGIVSNMNEAFRRYLTRGAPAWEGRFSYSAFEAISRIHQAGGLAVLAHPAHIDPGMRTQGLLIAELRHRGLDGLEVHYPSHTRKIRKKFQALAAEHHLLITGGSDFHGNSKAVNMATDSAFCPPCSLLAPLLARLDKKHEHRSI